MSADSQRADHFQRLYESASEGKCGHSGMSLPECKRSICDCFDFDWVVPAAGDCRCGCSDAMHVGEIGCPCGLPDEPPCTVLDHPVTPIVADYMCARCGLA